MDFFKYFCGNCVFNFLTVKCLLILSDRPYTLKNRTRSGDEYMIRGGNASYAKINGRLTPHLIKKNWIST